MLKHTGEYPIIGVNTFRNPHGEAVPGASSWRAATETRSRASSTRLRDFHTRHAAESPVQLKRLQQAVIDNGNVFAVLMDAVRCCSLGRSPTPLFGGRAVPAASDGGATLGRSPAAQ